MFIRCIMLSVPTVSRNRQKVGIQLWLNIKEVCMIRTWWDACIMTRWLGPSFWVAIHEDWKLWKQIMIYWMTGFYIMEKYIPVCDLSLADCQLTKVCRITWIWTKTCLCGPKTLKTLPSRPIWWQSGILVSQNSAFRWLQPQLTTTT